MTFAPRTWVVGEVVAAATLNAEIRDQFSSMFDTWTTYTPAWTASTTNPVLNNGSLTGRYIKIGRTVTCNINLVTGSTTTYGSGNHSFSLPVTAATSGTAVIGHAHILGATSTDRWAGQLVISSGSNSAAPFFPDAAADTRLSWMTAANPVVLAASNQVRMTLVYESAT
ncbi:hypothetical protein [Streptomyces sp. NPDC056723]|uniref:hypothetical protein n=1 Tax=Streptomyces sp. NPDC056723 TaxID=3345925 RepID=UPI003698C2E5